MAVADCGGPSVQKARGRLHRLTVLWNPSTARHTLGESMIPDSPPPAGLDPFNETDLQTELHELHQLNEQCQQLIREADHLLRRTVQKLISSQARLRTASSSPVEQGVVDQPYPLD